MTTKQKQWQLYFLGYYKGGIDGRWGNLSRKATVAFQTENGLTADGLFGPATEAKTNEIVQTVQRAVTGYSPNGLNIDGLAGSQTKAATAKYQAANGLNPDGIAGKDTRAKITGTPATDQAESTGNWWGEIKYFSRNEFQCKCGGKYCNGYPVEPAEATVRVLDKIRTHFGVPMPINSGVRCKKHNASKQVGGAVNSQHLYGTAADLATPGISPAKVAAYAETLLPNTGGIGIYSWGVHIDTRGAKSRWNG